MGFARLSASFIVVFVCVSVLGAQEVQVRNCDVLLPVFDVDYSKPTVLQPVTVVGARNGVFSGRVVLASKAPIKDVRATMNDLSGAGRIAVSNVAVRYALLHAPASGLSTAFDALSNAPPNESPVATKKTFGRLWQARSPAMGWALQPVWVTVRVPKDARPGAYRGKLTITVGKKTSFKVPVDLHVSAWTLPEPHDFRTFAELVHSPESVAMFYNVPFWSDRHFELMKSSLRLMSELGSRTTYLHLLCETNQGNAESMARWVRRPDGTFTHDFTLLERYLDLVLKEMGKPQFVCVYVWDNFLEGGQFSGDIKYESETVRTDRLDYRGKGPEVTVVEPDGKVHKERLPPYSDPKSRVLWKPLMTELRRRLRKRGLDKEVVLGMVTDTVPTPPIIELFKELMPGILWMRRGHMRRKDVHGVSLALQMGPSYNRWAYNTNPPGNRLHGWRGIKWRYPGLSVHFPRSWGDHVSRCRFRMLGEVNIAGAQRGFGGLGADFWPVLKDKRGRRRGTLSARYPKSSWRNLNIRTALLWAGPEGAESTVRFEMLREGIQECEARIFVEEALLEGKLKGTLAERCQSILDKRVHALKDGMGESWAYGGHWATKKNEFPKFIHGGWQQRSKTLYDAAADVARTLRD